jgi:hypothetical protein
MQAVSVSPLTPTRPDRAKASPDARPPACRLSSALLTDEIQELKNNCRIDDANLASTETIAAHSFKRRVTHDDADNNRLIGNPCKQRRSRVAGANIIPLDLVGNRDTLLREFQVCV